MLCVLDLTRFETAYLVTAIFLAVIGFLNLAPFLSFSESLALLSLCVVLLALRRIVDWYAVLIDQLFQTRMDLKDKISTGQLNKFRILFSSSEMKDW